jgi:membrane protease YdiL (CAAX protease family)
MLLFLGIIFIAGLIIVANWLAKAENETVNRLFDWLLVALNLPFFFLGFLLLQTPTDLLNRLQPNSTLPLTNTGLAGTVLIAMAVWGIAVSLHPIRGILSYWLPLNPASPVHALALVASGFLAGNTILTLTQGGLEELAATAASASVAEVVLQQALFVFLALLGVGLFIRRGTGELQRRLGLGRPTREQLLMAGRWIVILVVLQSAGGALSQALYPDQFELLDSISGQLFGNFDTVGEWLVLGLAAGIGEEVLFRGALQPALGLWFTAFLFALSHVQYGFSPITLVVFIIAVVLGYIRRRSNTTVAITVHAGYNFVLGLFSVIAANLAQSGGS